MRDQILRLRYRIGAARQRVALAFGTYSGEEFFMGNRDRQRKEPKKPKQPKKPTPASLV